MTNPTTQANKELALEALSEMPEITAKKARAFLMFEYDIEGKEATELLKEAGIGGGRSGGVAKDFYELLKEGVLEKDDFEEWLSQGSDNVKKHKAHYNSIRLLTNSIHESK